MRSRASRSWRRNSSAPRSSPRRPIRRVLSTRSLASRVASRRVPGWFSVTRPALVYRGLELFPHGGAVEAEDHFGGRALGGSISGDPAKHGDGVEALPIHPAARQPLGQQAKLTR